MRKFLVLAFAAILLSATAATAAELGAGCGAGKMVFEGKKGIAMQSLAWTTNWTLLNQMFAITSGTSGCNADSVILRDKEQEVFMAANVDSLSQDMAAGHGDYLNAMAELMGCDSSVYAAFGDMSQQRYDAIFASTNDAAALNNLKREVKAHPVLAAHCTRVS